MTRRTTDVGPDIADVRSARRFVAAALEEWKVARAEDLKIVASELVTNALLHAKSPVTVTIELLDHAVRLEVSDGSAVLPVIAEIEDGATRGRGMRIVEQLVDRWGADLVDGGKQVWVEADR